MRRRVVVTFADQLTGDALTAEDTEERKGGCIEPLEAALSVVESARGKHADDLMHAERCHRRPMTRLRRGACPAGTVFGPYSMRGRLHNTAAQLRNGTHSRALCGGREVVHHATRVSAPPQSLAVRLSMRLNPVVAAVLRSRAHWLLSRGLTLITVIGRRSGRRYTIPVGYLETADAVIVLVNDAPSKTWWRNYLDGGPIEVLMRGVWRHGAARTLAPDSSEFRRCADESFRRARLIPRLFGIAFDPQRGLTVEQLAHLARRAAIVRITLAPE